MGRVLVLGSLNLDLVVGVDQHPRPGETVLGGPIGRHFGGKGANQAVAAVAAAAATSMVGRVGDDDAGRRYVERLAARGVDVAALAVDPDAPTGHALIAVDAGGENTIIVSRGANANVGEAELGHLRGLGPGDVLLMSLEIDLEVVAAAARAGSERGARVVVNLSPYAEVADDVLRLADPVVVNEHEHALLGAAGLRPASLLVTRGAAGSGWTGVEIPAAPVAAVVDTTGAGDSYCGTLAARLAAGDAPEAAMVAAANAAAITITRVGAQPP